MGQFGIGQPVRRREDDRLIVGQGRFLDDIDVPGQAAAYLLRSPYAHAEITGIDVQAALAAPHVVGVLTAADYASAGLGALFSPIKITSKDGSPRADPPRWPLAVDRVRHVGDPVAMVVAEDLASAKDAAELIVVDYAVLPAVVDPIKAQAPGAPELWAEAPRNVCFDWESGDRAATDAAFAGAAHIAAIDIINNRVVANSLEPRGAIAVPEPGGRLCFYVSSQGAHAIRGDLCKQIFNLPPEAIRVVTPDVGGAFGMKAFTYPEYALVAWAAKRFERPVRWMAERSEAFLSDNQGRDHVTHAELALDADAHFLAMRASVTGNMGAYVSKFTPFILTGAQALLTGPYRTPLVYAEVKGVLTNTVAVDAYRGAGRPEANYVRERLIDAAAREVGIERAELRRRNFIPPEAMPYAAPLTFTFDSGEFARNLGDAQELADWAGFADRREESRVRGKLRGIGVASYLESSGASADEQATIRVDSAGTLTVRSGQMSGGQGHETAFAQIVEERLGVPWNAITVVQGDTGMVTTGGGTGGSRSLVFGGGAVLAAADAVIENGKTVAADLLEAAAADLDYAEAAFHVAGTDRRVGLFEVAANGSDGLEGVGTFAPEVGRTFPNGCHICELEVDPETGRVDILRYSVVDDFGKLLNPLLVEGQVQGGTAQGIGQALFEECSFDAESGQLLTGSFMDYALPRASDIPALAFAANEVLCPSNPLGVKGCGEAGATGAPPAVMNALLDALSAVGVTRIDMPATAERVWRAIAAATAA